MEVVVVDASILVKWYVVETFREEALDLRESYLKGDIELVSPAIMPFEVLNAVRYAKREIDEEKLKKVSRSLSLYGVQLYQLQGDYIDLVIETSLHNNITVYDASYVALAQYLETILYTADEKLIEKLSDDYTKYVKHIRGYNIQ